MALCKCGISEKWGENTIPKELSTSLIIPSLCCGPVHVGSRFLRQKYKKMDSSNDDRAVKRVEKIESELGPPSPSPFKSPEDEHDAVMEKGVWKRATNELTVPTPFNSIEDDNDAANGKGVWKRATNELTMPTPFNPLQDDHDAEDEKVVWKRATNELTMPTPFNPLEDDDDAVREKIAAFARNEGQQDEELGCPNNSIEQNLDERTLTNTMDNEEEDRMESSPTTNDTVAGLPMSASVRLSEVDPRKSAFGQVQDDDSTPFVPEAVLVQDGDDEVVIATIPEEEKVGFFERRGKMFAFGMCLSAVIAVILTSVFANKKKTETEKVILIRSDFPSMEPSSAPSFAAEPTLKTVQERGHVLCGLKSDTIAEGGFELKLVSSMILKICVHYFPQSP